MNKTEKIKTQAELINVLESQIVDLSMMSKIELGDDVIAEINRLKDLLNEPKSDHGYDLASLLFVLGFIGLASALIIAFI